MISYIAPTKVAKLLLQAIRNEPMPQTLSDFNRQVNNRNRLVSNMNAVAMNNAAFHIQQEKNRA